MALIQRCRLSKLGDLHDAEPFQLGLLGALLGQLEARPALPMPEATNLVPNIGVLLELVEDQARIRARVRVQGQGPGLGLGLGVGLGLGLGLGLLE